MLHSSHCAYDPPRFVAIPVNFGPKNLLVLTFPRPFLGRKFFPKLGLKSAKLEIR